MTFRGMDLRYGRIVRADRLLSLLFLLQGKGKVKARELAGRLEVSVRTIYRDVDALALAGVPVYAEPGPRGGIALVEEYRAGLTGLSRDEVEALTAVSPARALADLGFGAALDRALLKLAASLPAVHQLAAEHMRRRIHIDTAGWFEEKEETPHLEVLREAVWRDRRLRLEYRNRAGASREHTVSPYGLVAKLDRWYLVAAAEEATLVFRVSRVASAEILEAVFERPQRFELQAFWQDWCERFVVSRTGFPVTYRVTPAAAARVDVRVPWRPRDLERAAPAADGSKVLRFDFEREEYALHSLLVLGDTVEILEPESLRRRCAALGRDLQQLYADDGERDGSS